MLKRVDFPTFGIPTIPMHKLLLGLPNKTLAGAASSPFFPFAAIFVKFQEIAKT
jgi:hypothetical protein